MSNHLSSIIQSLRPRTLPLSVSGIVLGTGLAFTNTGFSAGLHEWTVFALAVATTLSLQILSNLSNELGDAQKGTDSGQTGRAAYGLQSGALTEQDIKRMIRLFIGLCVLSGSALILTAFGRSLAESWKEVALFFGLGLLAIAGAMTYTLGRHSYGYMGLGDLGVFLFFGLLSTAGAYYLQTHSLSWEAVACGAAIGLPCVGVLNLNNIRDMANDRLHDKHTFASWLGPRGARLYHTLLLVVCLSVFCLYGRWWTLLVVPVWGWHLWYVLSHSERLDKQMPVLMITTLCVAFLALI